MVASTRTVNSLAFAAVHSTIGKHHMHGFTISGVANNHKGSQQGMPCFFGGFFFIKEPDCLHCCSKAKSQELGIESTRSY